ncbi:hypothetical protein [Pseudarthrobacter sp. SSS035]|uniref:hypothetical protein n=1 Tax=Pseudarthrobacter sp. SSS035 TaxID=2931399 RepID=UPI00200C1E1D|nr:hypothetical protein [Pseudarthrobacter sp. SSS035]
MRARAALQKVDGGPARRSVLAEKVVRRTGKHWSAKLIKLMPTPALKAINSVMGRNFVTKYGTKQGIIVLGKVARSASGQPSAVP